MNSNRDNFSRSSIDILAKRVGYLCSNPDCRKLTIGSHDNANKSTTIGQAAHITAAAFSGPRYDNLLTIDQRGNIKNGIWLCSNCATLIDKDPHTYPTDLLESWKADAENESKTKLAEGYNTLRNDKAPFIEMEFLTIMRSRGNKGYSQKNPTRIEGNQSIMMIGSEPIIHWGIKWDFTVILSNNSSYPAFNVEVEIPENINLKFDLSQRIHNIPPFQQHKINATYNIMFEGNGKDVAIIADVQIPKDFEGLELRIKYQDEARNIRYTSITFVDGQIQNRRE